MNTTTTKTPERVTITDDETGDVILVIDFDVEPTTPNYPPAADERRGSEENEE